MAGRFALLGFALHGAGDLCEAVNHGAIGVVAPCELDLAADINAAKGDTDAFDGVDLHDAGRRDGDSDAGTDEAQDGEPVRGLLHDAWAKTVGFTER